MTQPARSQAPLVLPDFHTKRIKKDRYRPYTMGLRPFFVGLV